VWIQTIKLRKKACFELVLMRNKSHLCFCRWLKSSIKLIWFRGHSAFFLHLLKFWKIEFFVFCLFQKTFAVKLIRITEVPAFSLPMAIGQHQTHKTRIGLEIFLSEGFRSVWKNCCSEAERIFVETQKDFFEWMMLSYICNSKSLNPVRKPFGWCFYLGKVT
jgi:hypothetical protein